MFDRENEVQTRYKALIEQRRAEAEAERRHQAEAEAERQALLARELRVAEIRAKAHKACTFSAPPRGSTRGDGLIDRARTAAAPALQKVAQKAAEDARIAEDERAKIASLKRVAEAHIRDVLNLTNTPSLQATVPERQGCRLFNRWVTDVEGLKFIVAASSPDDVRVELVGRYKTRRASSLEELGLFLGTKSEWDYTLDRNCY